jgi:hypothetical protein
MGKQVFDGAQRYGEARQIGVRHGSLASALLIFPIDDTVDPVYAVFALLKKRTFNPHARAGLFVLQFLFLLHHFLQISVL